MYYRINNFSFDASRKDEMLVHTNSLRDAIRNIEGLQSVRLVEIGEGQIIGLACYNTEDNCIAATPKIQEMLGGLATFFISPPDSNDGSVIWEM